mmetsp:Transcript_13944/g.21268  ORF Transcript_13944/g.21268 Transcript_13944/m.21268 type:complete len:502 (+) Transcript_13944:71-1576(+)
MGDYIEPKWAKQPQQESWKLVEIKNGAEVAEHQLKKACVLLGRATDLVDIELAHESCSRLHARIAFDSRGVPWLRDLASTHGTSVNKKQLPSEASGKLESMSKKKGSRGVVLFPGDAVQFGGSSRIFLIDGPMGFERGALNVSMHQEKEPPTSLKRSEISEDRGNELKDVWNENSIPPKHKKLWETMRAKKYKYDNITTENERILAKGELSTGQERQVQRNNEKLLNLRDELSQIEEDLRNKAFAGEKVKYQSLFMAANDDDDVEDRTRPKLTLQESPETEESLILKWKSYQKQWVAQKVAMIKAESEVENIRSNMSLVKDEEDRFYLQNDFNLAKDVRDKISHRQSSLVIEIKATEELLKIVNKQIKLDLDSGYIGSASLYRQNMSASLSSTSVSPSPQTVRKLPPVPSFRTPTEKNPNDIVENATNVNKRRRVIGPALAKESSSESSQQNEHSKSTKTLKGDVCVPSSFGDKEKDVWRIPVGQDGSGRTKLNDKFKGRY